MDSLVRLARQHCPRAQFFVVGTKADLLPPEDKERFQAPPLLRQVQPGRPPRLVREQRGTLAQTSDPRFLRRPQTQWER